MRKSGEKKVTLEDAEVVECWPAEGEADDITYSKPAAAQLVGLSGVEQRKLSLGIAKVYGRSLEFLMTTAFQTYVHQSHVTILQQLRLDVTTFNVFEYAVRVRICKKTFAWHVQSVGLPGSLDSVKTSKMPGFL